MIINAVSDLDKFRKLIKMERDNVRDVHDSSRRCDGDYNKGSVEATV